MHIIRTVIFPLFVTVYLFFILICIVEILFFKKSTLMVFSVSKSRPWETRNEVQTSVVSPCLLRMEDAFNTLSLRWFLVFDTALVYHRSKTIDSDQVDVGIFSDDILSKNLSNIKLISTLKRFGFKLLVSNGRINQGQGWIIQCPDSNLRINMFVFYRTKSASNGEVSYKWWTKSHNEVCAKKNDPKCRIRFLDINLERVQAHDQSLYVTSQDFLIEYYGPDWKMFDLQTRNQPVEKNDVLVNKY